MKIVRFETGKEITRFDSRGATIGGVARCGGQVRISFLELEPGGVVGMHEAAGPQLLLVLDGTADVRAAEGDTTTIAQGQGAFWVESELHETTTRGGLTAVVVEADELELL